MRVLVQGPKLAARHLVLHGAQAQLRFGRDQGCDVVLEHLDVSRHHLSIRREGDVLRVRDCSSNGSVLGSQRLHNEEVLWSNGDDTLQVGPYQIARVCSATVQGGEERAGTQQERDQQLCRELHHGLIEGIDLAQLEANNKGKESLRLAVKSVLRSQFRKLDLCSETRKREDALVESVANEAVGLGALEALLADKDISEIMVVQPKLIYVESRGKIHKSCAAFSSESALRGAIERIVAPLGRRIDESNPYVDARLPDGSRVHAIIPPLAIHGPAITIRKFGNSHLSLEDLVESQSINQEMACLLRATVAGRKNIVVSGGTGSGKTTMLNILGQSIAQDERVVTIEDAAELCLPQEHLVALESKPANMEGKGAVSIRELVRNALRMRPDRILVGECRGAEALDMLQAMNTGHDGSMTTTHANSPLEAMHRLELLSMFAGVELPSRAIRQQIAGSVDLVVQTARLASGKRKVISIAEVCGLDTRGEFVLAEVFRFKNNHFRATGTLPSFLMSLIEQGHLPSGGFLA